MNCEDYPCCGHEQGDCDGRKHGSDESIKAQVEKDWADGHGYCDHSSGIFNCDGGADEDEEWCTDCDREVTVTERQCAEGFTGAPVYFTTFLFHHLLMRSSRSRCLRRHS